ncbi:MULTISPECIES: DNA mismatch repair endonuclease MutL [Halolamina]|uniref:DNA mismatch repair protein MutL n=1 Tax=Halolamina pelagica TaxID=699431 RepID=A0A1I5RUV2_9EURY|nr:MULTISPECIES: DNA mismatch repair endonuclease MutL [Halolamina]NHX35354.1 DNA mismatch repair endonuclease MutL [Halolamina sp. R1-12]SFP62233.1 DNA mismatch repair protein MutL [Halolamina pelagica]
MAGPDEGDPETPSITALDEETVQRIAAGEVVERPASVVKELVENSIDADASRVSIAVDRGGKDGIRVRDDGVGMTADELDLAVRDHHTSKIGDIGDLEAGVGTLGFRGEALAAIGAVARTTVRSKPRGGGMGHELTVEGGDIGEPEPAGCPAGTVVEVADLFYNVPARRKFLKTDATEFDHVNTVATQYALANPGVAVSLEHDDREVFATEGTGNLRSTVLSVYGREVAESMVDVEWSAAGDDVPVQSVRGLVSHPETTRAGREYLSTFVNDRYVTASALREAVLEAYGGQLAPDRYPFAVLFVELDPATVDVNVHPRKLEVRFDDEQGVRESVTEAVRDALLAEGLIRTSAPRGRSQADETPVRPGTDDEEAVGGADTQHEEASGVAERRAERSGGVRTQSGLDGADGSTAGDSSDAGVGEGADGTATELDDWDEDAGSSTAESTPSETDADDWSVDLSGGSDASSPTADESAAAGESGSVEPASPGRDDRTRSSARARSTDHAAESGRTTDSRDASSGRERSFSTATQQALGGGTAETGGEFDSLPTLRVLGQLQDTYVVAETDDGLVLIDQHAADERVNYERLQRQFADGMASQALAAPVDLELTAREAELFASHADALAEIGFEAERATGDGRPGAGNDATGDGRPSGGDGRTVEVTAVPAVFDATLDPELLRDALSAFVSAGDGEAAVDDAVDDLLADLACYPSVTGNTSLTEGSVSELLSALDDCENPYACPHGRPVIVEISGEEIGERFERDYPGHGERRRE